jgi:P27 family predicted phage terminase small subunit
MLKQGLRTSCADDTRAKYKIVASRTARPKGSRSEAGMEPPHYLTDDIALDEWRRITPLLADEGRKSTARRALFVGYCTAVAKAVRAEEILLREGRYYETETSRGSIMRRRHPAAADAEQAWSDVRKFAKQLGIAGLDSHSVADPEGRRSIFK